MGEIFPDDQGIQIAPQFYPPVVVRHGGPFCLRTGRGGPIFHLVRFELV